MFNLRAALILIALGAPFTAQAGTTLSLLDGTLGGTPLSSASTSGPETISLDAVGSGGVFVSGQAQSQVGLNRLYVANSTGLPFADTNTTLSGLSFWADNLTAQSGGTDPIHMTVRFSFEGTYIGPCCESDNPSSTFGNAYFAAAPGRFLDIGQANEDGAVTFQTSLGQAVLAGQYTQVPGGLLDFASLCEEDDGAEGCDPFQVQTFYTLEFDVDPGEEFWLASYFFVGNLAQGEEVDAFHTAKLEGIDVAPGVNLLSQSGQIVRRADGSFGLAAAVPEPASWAMLIVGFGAIGGAMRRRTGAVRTAA